MDYKIINTYEQRFGNIALEKGFIDSDKLSEALKYQLITDFRGAITVTQI